MSKIVQTWKNKKSLPCDRKTNSKIINSIPNDLQKNKVFTIFIIIRRLFFVDSMQFMSASVEQKVNVKYISQDFQSTSLGLVKQNILSKWLHI